MYPYLSILIKLVSTAGKEYAMIAMKITIAHVVRNLKLKTNIGMEDIQLHFYMEMALKHGYPVSMSWRK